MRERLDNPVFDGVEPINFRFEPFKDVSPKKIRRIVGTNKLARTPHFDEGDLEWEKQRFENGINELDVLKHEYGINIPTVELVIGTEETEVGSEAKILLVVDEIEGENLERLKMSQVDSELMRDKLDNLFCAIINYYSERFPGNYLYDTAKLEQYVYGRKKGESNEKTEIYLVDIDFIYGNDSDVFFNMSAIYDNVLSLESGLGGAKLGMTRAAMRAFVRSIGEPDLRTQKIHQDFIKLKQKLHLEDY